MFLFAIVLLKEYLYYGCLPSFRAFGFERRNIYEEENLYNKITQPNMYNNIISNIIIVNNKIRHLPIRQMSTKNI